MIDLKENFTKEDHYLTIDDAKRKRQPAEFESNEQELYSEIPIELDQVPEQIIKNIEQKYASATLIAAGIIRLSKGKALYEVEIEYKSLHYDLIFASDGLFLGIDY